MDIIQGNRAIAEFMGAYRPKETKNTYESTFLYKDGKRWIQPESLLYHSSWDWLMPVVEKISRITIEWENSDDRTDTYYPRTFGMLNESSRRPMVRINSSPCFESDTLIHATWLAVTDFIKYYTEKNDKN